MAKKNKASKTPDTTIALNRKARHEYEIEDTFEAGIVLDGWEVKSIRAGKVGIADSYVIIKNGEAWVLGMQITPLITASTHVNPDIHRTRKLLMHKTEIEKLQGKVDQKGYAIVALKLYWSNKNLVKCLVGLGKGKKLHDKRQTIKDRDWQRNKARILKKGE